MENNNKTIAIVGLVLGILVPVAGIIVSAIALNKIKVTGDVENAGLAKAGLIVGIILTALSIVGAICAVCTSLAAISAGLAGVFFLPFI